MRRWRWPLIVLALLSVALSLINASWIAPIPPGRLDLIADGGIGQRSSPGAEGCEARRIVAEEGNNYIENTLPSLYKALKLGAQSGSTDQQTISDVIMPSQHAFFGSNALAVQALKNGQVDGLVVDLPTAFYITAAQVKGSVIVGQLPVGPNPEQFGALLAKDSPLTDCVSKAIQALQADGTLTSIEMKWLAKEADAPVLQ